MTQRGNFAILFLLIAAARSSAQYSAYCFFFLNLKRCFPSQVIPTSPDAWLRAHNEMRRSVNAADMQMMIWDSTLQRMAEEWAYSCFTQGHRPEHSRQSAQYGYIGENLGWSSASLNERSATTLWYLEEQYYDHNSGRCAEGQECGHYTQVQLLL